MKTVIEKTEIPHTTTNLPRDKLSLTHHLKKLASPYSHKVKHILYKYLPEKGKWDEGLSYMQAYLITV